MIEAEKASNTTLTISRMCRLLGVDRRRFYEWQARLAVGPSARQQRAAELTAQIVAFHAASDGTYGAPRIRADLQDAGVVVSRKTVARLMRDQGIAGISPRLASGDHRARGGPVPGPGPGREGVRPG